ncbi:MAG: UDP-galactopyranose mutase [Spirosomataceae bacterium]
MKNVLIVGAGFSGAVVAEQLAKTNQFKIKVIDERNHVGGNCHTYRDNETNIMVHGYGPHIFNTDNQEVWDYIQKFTTMVPYKHQVKAISGGNVYSLPINLHTINQFFSRKLNPNEALSLLQEKAEYIENPQNFEEQALSFIGEDLYQAFFYGYTKKQWGCEPKELPASILKRLPVRLNYNDSYYHSKFVGIPKNGYTEIVEKMLTSENIHVELNVKYSNSFDSLTYDHIFYTGPIDAFFDYKYGRLGYRTVEFEKFVADGDFQGCSVMNYCEESVPYTRIHEHKFFTEWETHNKTVYFKEYSKETEEGDVPFYPKRLERDMKVLEKYIDDVHKLGKYTFLGRLATYRYMDMHHVIAEALEIAQKFIGSNECK